MTANDSSSPSSPDSGPAAGSSATGPKFPIVVLGGGAAGSAVLDALGDVGLAAEAALVEPSPYHYDQPQWMEVGTGGKEEEDTRATRPPNSASEATWIQASATGIRPDDQVVDTDDGGPVRYEYLVVALGIVPLWDRVRGLKSSVGSRGICSVYGYEQAERTWEMIRHFEGGRALFTAPSTPHKGGSAPLRMLRRAASLWHDTGVRAQTELFFAVAAPTGIERDTYDDGSDGDVHVYTGYDLIEVRPTAQEAVFSVTKGQSHTRQVLPYDLLHVVPPMRPPAVLEESGLAHRDGPMTGYLDVDPESLRHRRFGTVFGVGDALGVEGTKTGERARSQAQTVAHALGRLLTRGK